MSILAFRKGVAMTISRLMLIGFLVLAAAACSEDRRDATLGDPGAEMRFETAMRQAAVFQAAGDDRRAAELYRLAHAIAPAESAPLTAIGGMALRIGAPEQAALFFQSAIQVDPNDREARFGLAEAFICLDRAAEALALYEQLRADDPADAHARNGAVLAYDMARRDPVRVGAGALAFAVISRDP